jgi:segregation and condensation protein B
VSDELTAEALAQAAEAQEFSEAEVPSPDRVEDGGAEPVADAGAAEVPSADQVESGAGDLTRAAEAQEFSEAELPSPDQVEDGGAESDAGEVVESFTDSEVVDPDDFVVIAAESEDTERDRIKAVIEAVIYITDEPLAVQQMAQAIGRPIEVVKGILDELSADYARPDRGLSIRELAGGYKMATKPEHHEEIRAFVKNLKPPLKLSLAALETLAVIAYKQPITAPEIMEIRGVQGAGVLKTLLDRKLIATAGRKNVVGKPILYKTTREFLVQFGLKDLSELPTLKEFEELGRFALNDTETEMPAPSPEPAALVQEPGHIPAAHVQDPESPPIDATGSVEALDAPVEEPGSEPPVEDPRDEPAPVEDPREEPAPVEDPREPPPVEEPPPPPDEPEPPQKVAEDESNG